MLISHNHPLAVAVAVTVVTFSCPFSVNGLVMRERQDELGSLDSASHRYRHLSRPSETIVDNSIYVNDENIYSLERVLEGIEENEQPAHHMPTSPSPTIPLPTTPSTAETVSKMQCWFNLFQFFLFGWIALLLEVGFSDPMVIIYALLDSIYYMCKDESPPSLMPSTTNSPRTDSPSVSLTSQPTAAKTKNFAVAVPFSLALGGFGSGKKALDDDLTELIKGVLLEITGADEVIINSMTETDEGALVVDFNAVFMVEVDCSVEDCGAIDELMANVASETAEASQSSLVEAIDSGGFVAEMESAAYDMGVDIPELTIDTDSLVMEEVVIEVLAPPTIAPTSTPSLSPTVMFLGAPTPLELIIETGPPVALTFVSFCMCDEDFECFLQEVEEPKYVTFCIYTHYLNVEIKNFEIKMTNADESYVFHPVTFGTSTYVPHPELTTVTSYTSGNSNGFQVRTFYVHELFGGEGDHISVYARAKLEFTSETSENPVS